MWVEDDSEVVTTLPEVEPIVEPVDSKVPKQLDITPPVVSSPEGDSFILAKKSISIYILCLAIIKVMKTFSICKISKS